MYSVEEINEMVHRLRYLEKKSEDINNIIENIKSALKHEMETLGVEKLSGDDWTITWSTVQSNRFNQSLFRESFPELYDKFKTVSESRRFLLK